LLYDWERWSAELLETHLSYPVLAYFRSQHTNQSWLAALTAILDTCALIMAGMNDGPTRQAQLTFAMARHAVGDLAQIFARSRQPVLAPDRLPPSSLTALRDCWRRPVSQCRMVRLSRSFTICGRCMNHTSSA
jgi:hypothetical protein